MNSRKPISIRAISFLLVFTFLLSDLAWASPVDNIGKLLPEKPLATLLSDPTRFEAPLQFSSLKEIHRGDKNVFIIHIQDAHANLSGQQNLAKTLDEIMSKYGVDLVLSEGGSQDDTLTALKKMASRKVWDRLAKKFLIDGEIAGQEYLNLTSDHPMKIIGVEDKELYMKSLHAYADLAGKREHALESIGRAQSSLAKLKNKFYPEELISYEKERNQTAEKNFKALAALAVKNNLDLSSFEAIRKLLAVQDQESKMDFNLANLEQASLIEAIEKSGGGRELREYLESAGKLGKEKLAQFSYLRNTFIIAEKNGVEAREYPNLKEYLDYLEAFSKIDLARLIAESEVLEKKVYDMSLRANEVSEAIFSTEIASSPPAPRNDALLIHAIDRYLNLLRSAYSIQMSSEEFHLFEVNEPDFGEERYLAFINRKLAELGYFDDLLPLDRSLEDTKLALRDFYTSVGERDLAFIQKTQNALTEHQAKVAVLISGGYHTEHLTKLFKEQGYSYAVLTPTVTGETNRKKYESILLEPLTGNKKVLTADASKLSLADANTLVAASLMEPISTVRLGRVEEGARLANEKAALFVVNHFAAGEEEEGLVAVGENMAALAKAGIQIFGETNVARWPRVTYSDNVGERYFVDPGHDQSLTRKLKDRGFLRQEGSHYFWTNQKPTEVTLRSQGFTKKQIDRIIAHWYETHMHQTIRSVLKQLSGQPILHVIIAGGSIEGCLGVVFSSLLDEAQRLKKPLHVVLNEQVLFVDSSKKFADAVIDGFVQKVEKAALLFAIKYEGKLHQAFQVLSSRREEAPEVILSIYDRAQSSKGIQRIKNLTQASKKLKAGARLSSGVGSIAFESLRNDSLPSRLMKGWKERFLPENTYHKRRFDQYYPAMFERFVLHELETFEPGTPLRMADIGSGPHLWLANAMAKSRPSGTVTAIDVFPKTRFVKSPARHVRYRRTQTENLPLATNSCDFVVSSFTQGYLNLHQGAVEMRRVLRQGGKAVVLFDAPGSDDLRLETIWNDFHESYLSRSLFITRLAESLLKTVQDKTQYEKLMKRVHALLEQQGIEMQQEGTQHRGTSYEDFEYIAKHPKENSLARLNRIIRRQKTLEGWWSTDQSITSRMAANHNRLVSPATIRYFYKQRGFDAQVFILPKDDANALRNYAYGVVLTAQDPVSISHSKIGLTPKTSARELLTFEEIVELVRSRPYPATVVDHYGMMSYQVELLDENAMLEIDYPNDRSEIRVQIHYDLGSVDTYLFPLASNRKNFEALSDLLYRRWKKDQKRIRQENQKPLDPAIFDRLIEAMQLERRKQVDKNHYYQFIYHLRKQPGIVAQHHYHYYDVPAAKGNVGGYTVRMPRKLFVENSLAILRQSFEEKIKGVKFEEVEPLFRSIFKATWITGENEKFRYDDPAIIIRQEEVGGSLRIIVFDEGPGISTLNLNRLKSKFGLDSAKFVKMPNITRLEIIRGARLTAWEEGMEAVAEMKRIYEQDLYTLIHEDREYPIANALLHNLGNGRQRFSDNYESLKIDSAKTQFRVGTVRDVLAHMDAEFQMFLQPQDIDELVAWAKKHQAYGGTENLQGISARQYFAITSKAILDLEKSGGLTRERFTARYSEVLARWEKAKKRLLESVDWIEKSSAPLLPPVEERWVYDLANDINRLALSPRNIHLFPYRYGGDGFFVDFDTRNFLPVLGKESAHTSQVYCYIDPNSNGVNFDLFFKDMERRLGPIQDQAAWQAMKEKYKKLGTGARLAKKMVQKKPTKRAIVGPLLRKYKRLLQREKPSFREAARLMGVSNPSLFLYFERHPEEDPADYGIVKGEPGVPSEIPALLEKHKKSLKGLAVSEAAKLMGIKRATLTQYFRKRSINYKKLYEMVDKKYESRQNEYHQKLSGKFVEAWKAGNRESFLRLSPQLREVLRLLFISPTYKSEESIAKKYLKKFSTKSRSISAQAINAMKQSALEEWRRWENIKKWREARQQGRYEPAGKTKIGEFPIGKTEQLKAGKIKNFSQLKSATPQQILDIDGIGIKTLAEIKKVLRALGSVGGARLAENKAEDPASRWFYVRFAPKIGELMISCMAQEISMSQFRQEIEPLLKEIDEEGVFPKRFFDSKSSLKVEDLWDFLNGDFKSFLITKGYLLKSVSQSKGTLLIVSKIYKVLPLISPDGHRVTTYFVYDPYEIYSHAETAPARNEVVIVVSGPVADHDLKVVDKAREILADKENQLPDGTLDPALYRRNPFGWINVHFHGRDYKNPSPIQTQLEETLREQGLVYPAAYWQYLQDTVNEELAHFDALSYAIKKDARNAKDVEGSANAILRPDEKLLKGYFDDYAEHKKIIAEIIIEVEAALKSTWTNGVFVPDRVFTLTNVFAQGGGTEAQGELKLKAEMIARMMGEEPLNEFLAFVVGKDPLDPKISERIRRMALEAYQAHFLMPEERAHGARLASKVSAEEGLAGVRMVGNRERTFVDRKFGKTMLRIHGNLDEAIAKKIAAGVTRIHRHEARKAAKKGQKTYILNNCFELSQSLANLLRSLMKGFAADILRCDELDQTGPVRFMNHGVAYIWSSKHHIAIDITAKSYLKSQDKSLDIDAEVFVADTNENLEKALINYYGGDKWKTGQEDIMDMLGRDWNEGARLSVDKPLVSADEFRQAFRKINQLSRETIFDEAQQERIILKLISMKLEKGRRVLVVGPGGRDYMPALLAFCGLEVTAIDTDHMVQEIQEHLHRKLEVSESIQYFDSWQDLQEASSKNKFNYVLMFGVPNYAVTRNTRMLMAIRLMSSVPGADEETQNMVNGRVEGELYGMFAPIVPLLNPKHGHLFISDSEETMRRMSPMIRKIFDEYGKEQATPIRGIVRSDADLNFTLDQHPLGTFPKVGLTLEVRKIGGARLTARRGKLESRDFKIIWPKLHGRPATSLVSLTELVNHIPGVRVLAANKSRLTRMDSWTGLCLLGIKEGGFLTVTVAAPESIKGDIFDLYERVINDPYYHTIALVKNSDRYRQLEVEVGRITGKLAARLAGATARVTKEFDNSDGWMMPLEIELTVNGGRKKIGIRFQGMVAVDEGEARDVIAIKYLVYENTRFEGSPAELSMALDKQTHRVISTIGDFKNFKEFSQITAWLFLMVSKAWDKQGIEAAARLAENQPAPETLYGETEREVIYIMALAKDHFFKAAWKAMLIWGFNYSLTKEEVVNEDVLRKYFSYREKTSRKEFRFIRGIFTWAFLWKGSKKYILVHTAIERLSQKELVQLLPLVKQPTDFSDQDVRGHLLLGMKDKARMVEYVRGDQIMELGSAAGDILGLVKQKLPDAKVVGIEFDEELLKQARRNHPKIEFYRHDLTQWNIPSDFKGQFSTVIISSTLHEIDVSFGREMSRRVLKLAQDLLKPGGTLIFRDGVKPEPREVEVFLKTEYAKQKFEKFVKEYRHRKISFSYTDDSHKKVRLSSYDLHDFLSKYYFEGDLWNRDMDESAGQMTESQYRELLGDYFEIEHVEAYIAPYLQDRWKKDFEMERGEVYPNSHIFIVAKKPLAARLATATESLPEIGNTTMAEKVEQIRARFGDMERLGSGIQFWIYDKVRVKKKLSYREWLDADRFYAMLGLLDQLIKSANQYDVTEFRKFIAEHKDELAGLVKFMDSKLLIGETIATGSFSSHRPSNYNGSFDQPVPYQALSFYFPWVVFDGGSGLNGKFSNFKVAFQEIKESWAEIRLAIMAELPQAGARLAEEPKSGDLDWAKAEEALLGIERNLNKIREFVVVAPGVSKVYFEANYFTQITEVREIYDSFKQKKQISRDDLDRMLSLLHLLAYHAQLPRRTSSEAFDRWIWRILLGERNKETDGDADNREIAQRYFKRRERLFNSHGDKILNLAEKFEESMRLLSGIPDDEQTGGARLAEDSQARAGRAIRISQLIGDAAEKIYQTSLKHPEINDNELLGQFEALLKGHEELYSEMVPMISRWAKTTLLNKDYTSWEAFTLKLYQIFADRHPVISRRTFFQWVTAAFVTAPLASSILSTLTEPAAVVAEQVAAPIAESFILQFNEPAVLARVMARAKAGVLSSNSSPVLSTVVDNGIQLLWGKERDALNKFRAGANKILIGEAIQTVPGASDPLGLLDKNFGDVIHSHLVSQELQAKPELQALMGAIKRADATFQGMGPRAQGRFSNQLSQLAARKDMISAEELQTKLDASTESALKKNWSNYVAPTFMAGELLPYRIYLKVQDPKDPAKSYIVLLSQPERSNDSWQFPRYYEFASYEIYVFPVPEAPIPRGREELIFYKHRHLSPKNLPLKHRAQRAYIQVRNDEHGVPLEIFRDDFYLFGHNSYEWLEDTVRDWFEDWQKVMQVSRRSTPSLIEALDGDPRRLASFYWIAPGPAGGEEEPVREYLIHFDLAPEQDRYDIRVTPVKNAARWDDAANWKGDYVASIALKFDDQDRLLKPSGKSWEIIFGSGRNPDDYFWLTGFVQQRLDALVGRPFSVNEPEFVAHPEIFGRVGEGARLTARKSAAIRMIEELSRQREAKRFLVFLKKALHFKDKKRNSIAPPDRDAINLISEILIRQGTWTQKPATDADAFTAIWKMVDDPKTISFFDQTLVFYILRSLRGSNPAKSQLEFLRDTCQAKDYNAFANFKAGHSRLPRLAYVCACLFQDTYLLSVSANRVRGRSTIFDEARDLLSRTEALPVILEELEYASRNNGDGAVISKGDIKSANPVAVGIRELLEGMSVPAEVQDKTFIVEGISETNPYLPAALLWRGAKEVVVASISATFIFSTKRHIRETNDLAFSSGRNLGTCRFVNSTDGLNLPDAIVLSAGARLASYHDSFHEILDRLSEIKINAPEKPANEALEFLMQWQREWENKDESQRPLFFTKGKNEWRNNPVDILIGHLKNENYYPPYKNEIATFLLMAWKSKVSKRTLYRLLLVAIAPKSQSRKKAIEMQAASEILVMIAGMDKGARYWINGYLGQVISGRQHPPSTLLAHQLLLKIKLGARLAEAPKTSPDLLFVDAVIEKHRKRVGEIIKNPNVSLEKVLRLAKTHQNDILDRIQQLVSMKAQYAQGNYEATGVMVRLALEFSFTQNLRKNEDLYLDYVDALLEFTNVEETRKSKIVTNAEGYYEHYWIWAMTLSLKGGSEAIQILSDEIQTVGNEVFDPREDQFHDRHWSVAYQEILAEAIYLAKTYSTQDQKLKREVLNKALKLKSLHLQKIARIYLKQPIFNVNRRSVKDHLIALFYRSERLNQEAGGKSYSEPALADKTGLVKQEVARITGARLARIHQGVLNGQTLVTRLAGLVDILPYMELNEEIPFSLREVGQLPLRKKYGRLKVGTTYFKKKSDSRGLVYATGKPIYLGDDTATISVFKFGPNAYDIELHVVSKYTGKRFVSARYPFVRDGKFVTGHMNFSSPSPDKLLQMEILSGVIHDDLPWELQVITEDSFPRGSGLFSLDQKDHTVNFWSRNVRLVYRRSAEKPILKIQRAPWIAKDAWVATLWAPSEKGQHSEIPLDSIVLYQNGQVVTQNVAGKPMVGYWHLPQIPTVTHMANNAKAQWNVYWLANGGTFFPNSDADLVSIAYRKPDHLYNLEGKRVEIRLSGFGLSNQTKRYWVNFHGVSIGGKKVNARGVWYYDTKNKVSRHFVLFHDGAFCDPIDVTDQMAADTFPWGAGRQVSSDDVLADFILLCEGKLTRNAEYDLVTRLKALAVSDAQPFLEMLQRLTNDDTFSDPRLISPGDKLKIVTKMKQVLRGVAPKMFSGEAITTFYRAELESRTARLEARKKIRVARELKESFLMNRVRGLALQKKQAHLRSQEILDRKAHLLRTIRDSKETISVNEIKQALARFSSLLVVNSESARLFFAAEQASWNGSTRLLQGLVQEVNEFFRFEAAVKPKAAAARLANYTEMVRVLSHRGIHARPSAVLEILDQYARSYDESLIIKAHFNGYGRPESASLSKPTEMMMLAIDDRGQFELEFSSEKFDRERLKRLAKVFERVLRNEKVLHEQGPGSEYTETPDGRRLPSVEVWGIKDYKRFIDEALVLPLSSFAWQGGSMEYQDQRADFKTTLQFATVDERNQFITSLSDGTYRAFLHWGWAPEPSEWHFKPAEISEEDKNAVDSRTITLVAKRAYFTPYVSLSPHAQGTFVIMRSSIGSPRNLLNEEKRNALPPDSFKWMNYNITNTSPGSQFIGGSVGFPEGVRARSIPAAARLANDNQFKKFGIEIRNDHADFSKAPKNVAWAMDHRREIAYAPIAQKPDQFKKIKLLSPLGSLPRISEKERSVSSLGVFLGLAKIDGRVQPVAVKLYRKGGLSPGELIYAQVLDRLGIGAKFYGVVESGDVTGYVMQIILGGNTNTPEQHKDFLTVNELLRLAGFVVATEYRVTRAGELVAIDAGDLVPDEDDGDRTLEEFIRKNNAASQKGARLAGESRQWFSGEVVGEILDGGRCEFIGNIKGTDVGAVQAAKFPKGEVVVIKVSDFTDFAKQLHDNERRVIRAIRTLGKIREDKSYEGPQDLIPGFVGRVGNRVVNIFPYMRDLTLEKLFVRGKISLKETPEKYVKTAYAMAAAVNRLNALGFVHRDLKPSNFMWDEKDGEPGVVLLDFNISQHPGETPLHPNNETVFTTRAFQSPEQASLNFPPVSLTDDVYSFSLALVWLWAAHDDLVRDGIETHLASQLVQKNRKGELRYNDVEPLLEGNPLKEIILSGLRQPGKIYHSVSEMKEDIAKLEEIKPAASSQPKESFLTPGTNLPLRDPLFSLEGLSDADKKILTQFILSRLPETAPYPLAIHNNKIVSFEREGKMLYFLDSAGIRLMKDGQPLAFMPTPEDFEKIHNDILMRSQYSSNQTVFGEHSDNLSENLPLDDAAVSRVERAYERVQSQLGETQLIHVFDLDILPQGEEEFAAYLAHVLVILNAIQKLEIVKGVQFSVKSKDPSRIVQALHHPLGGLLLDLSALSEEQQNLLQVHLSLPSDLAEGHANLPMAALQKGQVAYLRAYILLSILAGRWQEGHKETTPHEAIVRLYGSFLEAAQARDSRLPQILGRFLKGEVSDEIRGLAVTFSLPAAARIAWGSTIEFFARTAHALARAA